MLALYLKIRNWFEAEEGQDLVEYALLVALIALLCIGAITAGGDAIQGVWDRISAALETAGVGG